ncbi:MAG TPA: hypothetical protein VMD30_13825 [Tepidisphaeraceae bacterium]|nr:hypothetical protein [Tepidisphaeraceae bacterium]
MENGRIMTGPADEVCSGPAVVAGDTPCRKCQYNLRSLALDGLCPECGTPVAMSIRGGDLLCYADPHWVERLARGTWLLLASILIGIGLGIVRGIVGVLTNTGEQMPAIWPVVSTAVGAVNLLGIFFATTRDPSGQGEDQYGAARKLARTMLPIVVMGGCVELIFDMKMTIPSMAWVIGLRVLTSITNVALVVLVFAFLQYLSKLALRIPDRRLYRRGTHVKWGFIVPFAIVMVVQDWVEMWRPDSGMEFLAFAMASLIYGILFLVFLNAMRAKLKENGLLLLRSQMMTLFMQPEDRSPAGTGTGS